jgi:hypothetical protein
MPPGRNAKAWTLLGSDLVPSVMLAVKLPDEAEDFRED